MIVLDCFRAQSEEIGVVVAKRSLLKIQNFDPNVANLVDGVVPSANRNDEKTVGEDVLDLLDLHPNFLDILCTDLLEEIHIEDVDLWMRPAFLESSHCNELQVSRNNLIGQSPTERCSTAKTTIGAIQHSFCSIA